MFDSLGSTTLTEPFIVRERVIEIAWAESDLDSFTPASLPVLATTTTTTGLPTKDPASPSRPQSNTPSETANGGSSSGHTSSGGLSTAVSAGIGVGAALAVLLVLAILIVLFKKRKNRRYAGNEVREKRTELAKTHSSELGSSPIYQLDHNGKPVEAHGSPRAELADNR